MYFISSSFLVSHGSNNSSSECKNNVCFYIRSHPLFLEDFRGDKRAVSLPVSVYFSPGRAKTQMFITPNEVHTVAIT